MIVHRSVGTANVLTPKTHRPARETAQRVVEMVSVHMMSPQSFVQLTVPLSVEMACVPMQKAPTSVR